MKIQKILTELNLNNSSNYKISILEKHKENKTFQRVLVFTYDIVKYNFFIGKTTIENMDFENLEEIYFLEEILDVLEKEFCTRLVTGNEALERLTFVLSRTSFENREICKKIISRNLKINLGKTQINKVLKNFITKQIYCRCDIFNEKNSKNINFKYGAFVQKKSDGTYKEITNADEVSIVSRSGESYKMPLFEQIFKDLPKGIYVGEMTVFLDDELFEKIMPKLRIKNPKKALEIENNFKNGKTILDRATGNGLINSDDIPEKNIIFEMWDFVSFDDYQKAGLKNKNNLPKTTYYERFETLKNIVEDSYKSFRIDCLKLIDYKIVYSLKDATDYVTELMKDGFEGGVLKDFNMIFKDGTSKQQLKLKAEISLDLRIVEFLEGNFGSKNEKFFSAIVVENDEKTIRTQISVTTLTEAERDWFFENKESLIGQIMEVSCNDITMGSGKKEYALSHGKFVQMRTGEKTETDSLEKSLLIKEMSFSLK